MVVDPYAVRIARPTAMPTMRATVTVEDATPYASRPTASTAAVERGVTVSPNPAPKMPSASAASSTDVTDVQRAIATRAPIDAARPAIVTILKLRTRTAKPDRRAPAAVAPASAPRARRCSSGPPYRTRSTNTAPPTIAVANPYPVSAETAVADENEALRNRRGSRKGSRTRSPRTIVRTSPRTAATTSTADTRAGSTPPSASGRLPISVSAPSDPTRNAENSTAPTRSIRPSRRGVSQSALAAQAIAIAAIPTGTLT